MCLGPDNWITCDDSNYEWNTVEKNKIGGCAAFEFDLQKSDGTQNTRIEVNHFVSSTDYDSSDSAVSCPGGSKSWDDSFPIILLTSTTGCQQCVNSHFATYSRDI